MGADVPSCHTAGAGLPGRPVALRLGPRLAAPQPRERGERQSEADRCVPGATHSIETAPLRRGGLSDSKNKRPLFGGSHCGENWRSRETAGAGGLCPAGLGVELRRPGGAHMHSRGAGASLRCHGARTRWRGPALPGAELCPPCPPKKHTVSDQSAV